MAIDAIAGALVDVGVGETTAGVAAGALEGAGVGALSSGITGGNPLEGALIGGATGGIASGLSTEFGPSTVGLGAETASATQGELGFNNLAQQASFDFGGGTAGFGAAQNLAFEAQANPAAFDAAFGLNPGDPGFVAPTANAAGPSTIGGAVAPAADAATAAVPAVIAADVANSGIVGAGEIGGGNAAADFTATPAFTNTPQFGAGAGLTQAPLDATGVPSTAFQPAAASTPTTGIGGGAASGGSFAPEATAVSPIPDPSISPDLSNAIGSGGQFGAGGGFPQDGINTSSFGGLTGQSLTDFTSAPTIERAAPPTDSGIFGSGITGRDISSFLGPAVAATGLGLQAMNQPRLPNPNTLSNKLQTNADTQQAQVQPLIQQGQSFINPLQTGQLPPGANAAVDSATQAAEATVRSQYASMGLTGSTMEASSIANVKQAAEAQRFEIATKMAQTGLNEVQLGLLGQQGANQIYQNLISQTLQQDQALQQAIASFSGALAGGQPRYQITAA